MAHQDAKTYDVDEEDSIIKFSDFFEPKTILGKGTFGIVVGAVMKSNRKEYAVKIIKKTHIFGILISDFMQEAEILSQLNHPNIVKFVKILESDSKIFLVMEWVRGGRLIDLISERNKLKNPLADEECALIMKNILSGVEYIHSKDILHRDLKPENILLEDKNDLSSIKICDFGLSAQYDLPAQVRSFNEICGTKIFMAPEFWSIKKYSKQVDMWSCGIVLYILISGGRHPLWVKSDTPDTYLAKLLNPNWEYTITFNKYSKHLFSKLVQSDPQFRYTAEVAKGHPWITRKFDEQAPLMGSEKIKAYSKSLVALRIIKILYMSHQMEGNTDPASNSYKELTQNMEEELNKTGKNRYSVNVKDAIRDVIASLLTDPDKRESIEYDMYTTPPRDFFFRAGATRDRSNTDYNYNNSRLKSYKKSGTDKGLDPTPPKNRYCIFKNLFLSPLSSSVDIADLKSIKNKDTGLNNNAPQTLDNSMTNMTISFPKKISDDHVNESSFIKIAESDPPLEFQTLSTINNEDQSSVKYSDTINFQNMNNNNAKSEKFAKPNIPLMNISQSTNSGSESSIKSRSKNFLLGSLMKASESKNNKIANGYNVRTGMSRVSDEKNLNNSYYKTNSVEKEKSSSVEKRTYQPRNTSLLNSSLDTINMQFELNKKRNKKPVQGEKKKKPAETKKLPQIFDRLFTETTERFRQSATISQEPVIGVRSTQSRTSNFQKLVERSSTNFLEKKSILFSPDFYNLPKIKLISNQQEK